MGEQVHVSDDVMRQVTDMAVDARIASRRLAKADTRWKNRACWPLPIHSKSIRR